MGSIIPNLLPTSVHCLFRVNLNVDWHHQVVVVPCGVTASLSEADTKALYSQCEQLASDLNTKDVRARADIRDNYSPGWKFNHWELKASSHPLT